MASNNGNSNLYPDWYNQNLNDDLPSDLQDIEPYNPSWPKYQVDQIAGTSFAGVEELWPNDPSVGTKYQSKNMATNDEVVYPRPASNSPRRRQYSDLQISDLGEQFGSSSLQIDAAPNYGNSNRLNQGHSLYPMEHLTPLQPSESYEFYPNELRSNLTTEYGPSTHWDPDYILHDLSVPGINIVPGECGLSYLDFGVQPIHEGVAEEPSSNNQLLEDRHICSGADTLSSFDVNESVNHGVLREGEPSCSSLNRPSGSAFVGDPRNSSALGRTETSFTLLGAYQPPEDRSNKISGLSSGADPCRTQSRSAVSKAGGSSTFPQDCGGETSDSSSYSYCQDNLASNPRSQRHKRYRTAKSKYDTMTPEEKLLLKRTQEAKASQKYWEGKRISETQTRNNIDAESTRNLHLQGNLARDELRVQLLNLALRNLNIYLNGRHAEDEDEEDTFKE